MQDFKTMNFKYGSEIDSLTNCPPSSCTCREIEAFRFVFDDLDHTNNFLPPFVINPRRRNDSADNTCGGYGLSFYDSHENAAKRYRALSKVNKRIYKHLGTHIARGMLAEADGVMTAPDGSGHFDLHEFVGANLKNKFVIISKVFNGKD